MMQDRLFNDLLPEAAFMRTREVFFLLAAGAVGCASLAYGQDSQSLGDAARQLRLQKAQKQAKAKDAPANSNDAQPAKAPKKVVTNDDIPQHVGSTLTSTRNPRTPGPTYPPPSYAPRKAPAEVWKSLIQRQKDAIASWQREIDQLSESIRYRENCVADCAQRNESQREKEQQLESMQAQLEQQQKRLEDLQDAARKQGLGSSVYDP